MAEQGNPPAVEVDRFGSEAEASEAAFVLRTVGISVAVRSQLEGANGHATLAWALFVPPHQHERAAEILAEERDARPPAEPPVEPGPRPRLYWVIGLMVANVCAWLALEGTGGSKKRANLIRFGASHPPNILGKGEIWRPLTAMYLHIGAKHLLANMFSLGVFGPLALFQWGAGRFLGVYLASGLGGNLLSLALAPRYRGAKAGASGAVLGLLGSLAGGRAADLRRARQRGPQRLKTWHMVAMLVAFYGFAVGAGPADHVAHVGGIVVGFVWGLFVPGPGLLQPGAPDRLGRWLGLGSTALTLLAGGAAAVTALVF